MNNIVKFHDAKDFMRDDIPVEVITREGCEVFPNLNSAQQVYPGLDLFNHSPRFTWAMRGYDPETGGVRARFEDWDTYNLLSM